MPVHWSLEGDVLTLAFDGDYSFLEIADAARAGVGAATGPVRLIVDATGTARLPDATGVRQRIDLLRALHDRLAGPVAIVATPGAMYGIARQVALQAERTERITIQVFESRDEARRWMVGHPGRE